MYAIFDIKSLLITILLIISVVAHVRKEIPNEVTCISITLILHSIFNFWVASIPLMEDFSIFISSLSLTLDISFIIFCISIGIYKSSNKIIKRLNERPKYSYCSKKPLAVQNSTLDNYDIEHYLISDLDECINDIKSLPDAFKDNFCGRECVINKEKCTFDNSNCLKFRIENKLQNLPKSDINSSKDIIRNNMETYLCGNVCPLQRGESEVC